MVPISGFTIVRNAVKLDFPVLESIRSLLPVCEAEDFDICLLDLNYARDTTSGVEGMELLLDKLKLTKTNKEFLDSMARG